jgi:chloramphenicol 3-O-phosphotransferase
VKRLDRRFVVVSGLPGSGKTTVARALASLLDLPVIDKDEILERLFDTKGVGDSKWRRELSRESDRILQSTASSSNGAVITSFWHVAGMPSDSGTPTEWIAELSRALVNVHCHCPPDVAADRFLRRRRHPGHLDGTRTVAEVEASIHALVPYGPLALGEPVVIDTVSAGVPSALLELVEAGFGRCVTLPMRRGM